MPVSRDEARELAIVALLAGVGLRIGAGMVQLIEEAGGAWTVRSLAGRFFAPIGSTIGLLVLGAVLIVVLSPSGSVTRGVAVACRWAAATVAGLGLAASLHTVAFSYSPNLTKLWFAMINGVTATVLGGAAYYILRNFDDAR